MKTITFNEKDFEKLFKRAQLGDIDTAQHLWSVAQGMAAGGEFKAGSHEATYTVTRTDLETVAAFAAEIIDNPKHHDFYEKFCDDMDGFFGFYQIAIDMAAPVNEAAKAKTLCFRTVPFLELLDGMTNRFLNRSLKNGERVHDFRALFKEVHDEVKAEDAAATARLASFSRQDSGMKL